MRTIPPAFAEHMKTVHGDDGIAWIDGLPALIGRYEERWSLTVGEPYALSWNFVAPAERADGTRVVLKVGIPHPELRTEIEALRVYNGHGICQMYESDIDAGVFVLERLMPGTPLVEWPDDALATVIAADVMHRLWCPVADDHPFPTVDRWARGLERLRSHFDGTTGPFAAALVDQAERTFAELIPTQGTQVLLHGDLHHWNIVQGEREPWLALDPKGIVGEAAYEVGAYIRNPMPQIGDWHNLRGMLERRIDLFHDRLGFDRERMRGWSMAQAVLAAWWYYEDAGIVEHACLAVAEALS